MTSPRSSRQRARVAEASKLSDIGADLRQEPTLGVAASPFFRECSREMAANDVERVRLAFGAGPAKGVQFCTDRDAHRCDSPHSTTIREPSRPGEFVARVHAPLSRATAT